MVATEAPSSPAPASLRIDMLGARDVKAMAELVSAAQPGPFERRTPELGLYVGIRDGGRLVAMAGERMRVPGYVELSAICTLPSSRQRGFAGLLVQHLMRCALQRGEIPFLHVAVANTPAVTLYQKLGFTVRAELQVLRRRPIRHR
jgi:predicted GNAT family acetyltransferase